MKTVWLLGAVLVGSVMLAGCSEQECLALPCPFFPAVSLTVVDAVDGGPVANPVANGLVRDLRCLHPDEAGRGHDSGRNDLDRRDRRGLRPPRAGRDRPCSDAEPCSCQADYVPQTRDVSLPRPAVRGVAGPEGPGRSIVASVRADIVPGASFPDYELPDHRGKHRKLSELQGADPMVLVLCRGGFCPKDRRQHEGLLQLHREMRSATAGS